MFINIYKVIVNIYQDKYLTGRVAGSQRGNGIDCSRRRDAERSLPLARRRGCILVMSQREAVIEANRSFYRAFESLQVENMESVWSRDASIVCIHPGWRKLEGWGPVMNSWDRIFDNVFEMKFEITELDVRVSGDLAVVVTEENLAQRGYDGMGRSQVLATNVFERNGEKWLLVLHHGSPVMQAPGEETPLQ